MASDTPIRKPRMPSHRTTPSGNLLDQAHAALHRKDAIAAEQHFTRLLQEQPAHVEALRFLANRAVKSGQPERALELTRTALKAQPDDAAAWHQLATLQMNAGDLAGAVASLRRTLELAPDTFVARLRLGMVLEKMHDPHAALVAYFGAITSAQSHGLWRDDAGTPPGMRQAVKQAMQYVDRGRHMLFHAALDPLRQRYGGPAIERIEQGLAIYLGEKPAHYSDPRQRPKFLYVPGLPSRTYYAQERFPEHRKLEAALGVVQDELHRILAADRDSKTLEGFYGEGVDTRRLLDARDGVEPAWDAFFFHRHGARYDANCKACPATDALLEALDLVRISDHAPEILFSVLRPGTRIRLHRGVTNTRLVTHLPLIIPPDCALRVGGEIHHWQEGRCMTFDDTFEHEAWNHSDRTRVVMIMDTWNPDLTEIERRAVHDLVVAIGGFNRDCKAA